MSEFGRFLLPGPVEIHPEVMAALQRPMISPWSDEARALLNALQPGLQRLFRTVQPVLLSATTSTGLLEAVIRSAVPRRGLAVCSGFFGDRLAETLAVCGREVVRVHVQPGRALEPEQLDRFLAGPPVDAVLLVHSETSTGALAPLQELARLIRDRTDALVVVDAVSSVGAVPVESDAWGLDFVFTGSQKALALPPGLALGVASSRLLERAARVAGRGWYLDLLAYERAARTAWPVQTPPLTHLFALECQLQRIERDGGVEARWRRHAAMLTLVEEWVGAASGFELLAPAGRRSASVSAVVPPSGTAGRLLAGMRARGFTLAGGLGSLTDRLIRIGHMGDATPATLGVALTALGEVAREAM